MDLVVKGFQTIVIAGFVGGPALISNMTEFLKVLKNVHESLTKRWLSLKDLGSHCIIAADCVLLMRCGVSQSGRPNMKLHGLALSLVVDVLVNILNRQGNPTLWKGGKYMNIRGF